MSHLQRIIVKFKQQSEKDNFNRIHYITYALQNNLHYITHNLLHFSEPKYLRKLRNVKPSGKTRSSEYLCLLLPPLIYTLKFSNHCFCIFALHLWNSLPPNLRTYAPVSDESIINITNINHSSVSSTSNLYPYPEIVFFHALKPTSSSFPFPIILSSAMLHFPSWLNHF